MYLNRETFLSTRSLLVWLMSSYLPGSNSRKTWRSCDGLEVWLDSVDGRSARHTTEIKEDSFLPNISGHFSCYTFYMNILGSPEEVMIYTADMTMVHLASVWVMIYCLIINNIIYKMITIEHACQNMPTSLKIILLIWKVNSTIFIIIADRRKAKGLLYKM